MAGRSAYWWIVPPLLRHSTKNRAGCASALFRTNQSIGYQNCDPSSYSSFSSRVKELQNDRGLWKPAQASETLDYIYTKPIPLVFEMRLSSVPAKAARLSASNASNALSSSSLS